MKDIKLSKRRWNLVTKHEKLVDVTIKSLSNKIPSLKADIDEYKEAATWALINSANKFDFKRDTQFSTYAITSIRREIINKAKQNALKNKRFRNIEDDIEPFSTDNNTLDKMIDVEALLALKGVCKSLPEKDKKIVRMRFVEGKTFEEIGRELQVTREMARVYYKQMLGRIEKQLERV